METLSQKYLRHAYDQVSKREKMEKGDKDKYGVWCHGLPGLIRNSGLCQAISFLDSKKGKEAGINALLEDLRGIDGLPPGDLLQVVKDCDAVSYMVYTERVLECLQFFKRFAVSILKVEQGQEPQ